MSFLKRLVPLKAKMNLSLENGIQVGVTKGTATLSSDDEFKAEEMRMELKIWENYQTTKRVRDSKGNYRNETVTTSLTHHDEKIPICGPFELGKGQQKVVPIEVKIPQYSIVYHGPLHYSLKAVANVKGRPDVFEEVKL